MSVNISVNNWTRFDSLFLSQPFIIIIIIYLDQATWSAARLRQTHYLFCPFPNHHRHHLIRKTRTKKLIN